MSDRRRELLERALKYLVEHGVADLSLRPLGTAIGTSARLLVYHFGSRAGLLTAIMDELRLRLQRSFTQFAGGLRESDAPLEAVWAWATARKQLPYLRVLFEVQVLAIQHPSEFGAYLDRTSSSWSAVIEHSLPPGRRRRALATLYAAVIDGLLLELLSTGDRRRTTEALRAFEQMLRRAGNAW